MPENYDIVWRKWLDPFKTIFDAYKRADKEDDFEKSDFDNSNEYNGPVVMTPHGLVPINEANLPSTIFNFWRADTNFWMTKKIEFAINTTLGVEAFDLISPLRFRIAIGTCFDEEDVKRRVKLNVLDYLKSANVETKPISNDMEVLAKQYKFFAIVEKDKLKQVISGNNKQEVLDKVQAFTKDGVYNVRYSWGS